MIDAVASAAIPLEMTDRLLKDGLLTRYESYQIRIGLAFLEFSEIDQTFSIGWSSSAQLFGNRPEKRKLTPERMLEIQADHLLGLGDGKTTRSTEPEEDTDERT